jgi:hypothetical protein
MSDADFFAVRLRTYERCDLTPAMGQTEVGVRIAAPRRVIAGGRSMTIPICAVVGYDPPLAKHFPREFWAGVVAVAIEVDGGRAQAATLAEVEPPPPPPKSEDDGKPPDLPFLFVVYERCNNFDLLRYLSLPRAPGLYDVFLTTGREHSNVVRIEVVPPPREAP